MGRRIRWLGVVLILCFGLVIVQLTNIQFRRAAALAHSPQNPVNGRSYDNQRGDIFAEDGTLLAQSVRIEPSGSKTWQFQRRYPTPNPSIFSQIVGTCSPIYCDTGIEGQYAGALGLHKQPAQTLSQLLSPPPSTTDDVTITINPSLQAQAYQQLANLPGPNKDGAIVMLNPKTGAVIAMASVPTYDPAPLVSTDFNAEASARAAAQQPDGEGFKPLYPIGSYYTIHPGSTAKVITTAAIYNLDPALATYKFPVQSCLTNIP